MPNRRQVDFYLSYFTHRTRLPIEEFGNELKNLITARNLFFMKIGYALISTHDQNLDLQIDALTSAGCEKVFRDVASGARDDRPGLIEALDYCRAGDSLVVWKLDRLGRSLKHLIETVNRLSENKVGFVSLQENINTQIPGGKLIFHVFGALAEFERELIRERTKAGLEAARARGRTGGRPRLLKRNQILLAKKLLMDKSNSISFICETLKISKTTLYRYRDVKL